jgi:hypothetical protein
MRAIVQGSGWMAEGSGRSRRCAHVIVFDPPLMGDSLRSRIANELWGIVPGPLGAQSRFAVVERRSAPKEFEPTIFRPVSARAREPNARGDGHFQEGSFVRHWVTAPLASVRLLVRKLAFVAHRSEIPDNQDIEFVRIVTAPAL